LLLQARSKLKRLKERRDIDCPDDLPFIEEKAWFRTRLSVIIPTLSSIKQLAPSLESLQKQIWPDDEIIVEQAEREEHHLSHPEPQQIAPQSLSVFAPRGRVLQLNRGSCAVMQSTKKWEVSKNHS
jgi:hypothetical protein